MCNHNVLSQECMILTLTLYLRLLVRGEKGGEHKVPAAFFSETV